MNTNTNTNYNTSISSINNSNNNNYENKMISMEVTESYTSNEVLSTSLHTTGISAPHPENKETGNRSQEGTPSMQDTAPAFSNSMSKTEIPDLVQDPLKREESNKK